MRLGWSPMSVRMQSPKVSSVGQHPSGSAPSLDSSCKLDLQNGVLRVRNTMNQGALLYIKNPPDCGRGYPGVKNSFTSELLCSKVNRDAYLINADGLKRNPL